MLEKGARFDVLDHGYVTLIDWMGEDADIIRAARMSTGRGFEGWEPTTRCVACRCLEGEVHDIECKEANGPGPVKFIRTAGDFALLETLMSQKHTTPFEMVELKLEVQAPILVFREWMRHRTQSYSEFSARYAQMPNIHYIPELERICKQSTTNKQGSAEPLNAEIAEKLRSGLIEEQNEIYIHYDTLISEFGIAKEIARINTPVSRYSKMTVKTDLWNWLAFLNLREDPPAQWEIREYAKVIAHTIIAQLFPKTYELWLEYMRYAIRLSRMEHNVIRTFLHELEAKDSTVLARLRDIAKTQLTGKKADNFMRKVLTHRE